MSKKNLILVISLVIIGGSLYMVKDANALTSNPTLINRIAEKFNLKQDEVQKVAQDFRLEKMKTIQDQRKKNFEEKLIQAVKNGTITEAQKQAFLKKFDELQKNRESERAEMQDWAKQNGLDNLEMKFGFRHFKFGR